MIVDMLRNDRRIRPERVLIDHVEEHTVRLALDHGFWCAMTLYPTTKCTPERAADILERYGTDRIMANSAGDWGKSNPLAVPELIQEVKRCRGIRKTSFARSSTTTRSPLAAEQTLGAIGDVLPRHRDFLRRNRCGRLHRRAARARQRHCLADRPARAVRRGRARSRRSRSRPTVASGHRRGAPHGQRSARSDRRGRRAQHAGAWSARYWWA